MKHRIIYLLSALCILLTGCSALPGNTGDEIAYWTGETPFNAAVIPAAPTCTDGVFYADGQALPTETFSGGTAHLPLVPIWWADLPPEPAGGLVCRAHLRLHGRRPVPPA